MSSPNCLENELFEVYWMYLLYFLDNKLFWIEHNGIESGNFINAPIDTCLNIRLLYYTILEMQKMIKINPIKITLGASSN